MNSIHPLIKKLHDKKDGWLYKQMEENSRHFKELPSWIQDLLVSTPKVDR